MSDSILKRNRRCRICRGRNLKKFLSLGTMPPANAFLSEQKLKRREAQFPLEVYRCGDCSLVQLVDILSPKVLFKDYVYFSSTSESFVAHFRRFARQVWDQLSLPMGALVVDIGSNDGILLKPFKELGARVLGVEPAKNIAKIANGEGVETLPEFFSEKLARRIAKTRCRAAVVTATNVFAHVNDLDAFVGAVKTLLDEEGVFIFEVPYLLDFVEKNLFDTVYHEHLSYFSLKPLVRFFERMDMSIFDAQRVGSHGGSLRVFVKKSRSSRPVEESVQALINLEKAAKLNTLATMKNFSRRVEGMKAALGQLLADLKSKKKKIAGYGAPAKGNTLLNYFGIDMGTLDYIVDDSPWKQGLYTPGTHIPVVSQERIEKDRPDYILILAWNFAEPIMKKLEAFRAQGGGFIIPVPEPRIVSPNGQ